MDLIYTNENNVEMGVLSAYDLDLAFGSDENDFSISMAISDNKLVAGSHIYYEGTEYGGIVDAIAIDTEKSTITYSGRTWHGVLAGKVIIPPKNADHTVLNGEANSVLAELIEACDLDGLFAVATNNSGIEIINEEFRYSNLYESIVAMLANVGARLKMYRIGRYVMIEAVPLMNYANNEEWDTTNKTFDAEAVTTRVNHIICLGSGTGADRYVIHLFADADGNIQDYATLRDDLLYDDSGYILDKRNQVLTDINEVIEVYDNASARDTENYVLLTACPPKFGQNYEKYYWLVQDANGNDKYETPAPETVVDYPFLTDQPNNWDKRYSNYYDANEEPLTGVVVEEYYEELPRGTSPTVKDWKKNYANYYYLKTDGVSEPTWTAVQGVDVQDYVEQVRKPSDWTDNWGNYYFQAYEMARVEKIKYKDKDGKDKEKIPSFTVGKYYKRTDAGVYIKLKTKPNKWDEEFSNYYEAKGAAKAPLREWFTKRPEWKKRKFYTLTTVKTVAPKWDAGKTYGRKHPKTTIAPTWAANTYKRKRTRIIKPKFNDGHLYYELHVDHYRELVAGGLKKLEEYRNCDSINMNLPVLGYEYYIGDIVGASAEAQGFSVQPQAITKKIIKADKNGLSISYKIGV